MDVSKVVELVFVPPPKSICTYSLVTPYSDPKEPGMFRILMDILMSGARKIFGPDVTAQNITSSQFEELKKYMGSIGFKVKHNFTCDPVSQLPLFVNIWFERYELQKACNGSIRYM